MYELHPYFTNDGSVGLFSPADDDIYHSTYGALTEALEKFVLPAEPEKYFSSNRNIKILDICFGIGYNSKTFFDFFLKNILYKNNTIAPIHTDNILTATSNKIMPKYNIYIRAVDTDKTLSFLAPFMVTGNTKKLKNKKLNFSDERIEKFLCADENNPKKDKENKNITLRSARTNCSNYISGFFIKNNNPKLSSETNIIFLQEIIKNAPEVLTDPTINQLLSEKTYKEFFDRTIVDLFNFERNKRYKHTPQRRLDTFLHNIYYNHLSNSYKKALKALKLCDFNLDLKIEDARSAVQNDNNLYNFIFLDAFTPAKCPCLWTLDFFKLLYHHLDDNGLILTYSNSAAVRHAFLQAGFNVGKIYNTSAGKFMGTIAAKNSTLIKNNLTEYDLGLTKTKAGIVYRDKYLNATNEAIINAHRISVENSDLESSSSYIKRARRKNNV